MRRETELQGALAEGARTVPGSAVGSPAGRPDLEHAEGRYLLRFARDDRDLDALLRLRFEVFNLELDEGLAQSWRTRRDTDEFDRQCHHILVEDQETGEAVGTYRVQTTEMAERGRGFYSATEFDLAALAQEDVVEIGRACIARAHRNHKVLFLLWKGLRSYGLWNDKKTYFGCCSLTSQDPLEGMRVHAWLRAHGHMHPRIETPPLPGYECLSPQDASLDDLPEVDIPQLFGTYLRFGAHICGPPAIDRRFQTIDFLALLDTDRMDPRVLGMFSI